MKTRNATTIAAALAAGGLLCCTAAWAGDYSEHQDRSRERSRMGQDYDDYDLDDRTRHEQRRREYERGRIGEDWDDDQSATGDYESRFEELESDYDATHDPTTDEYPYKVPSDY